jgi:broad specificity phosphatase PhoE
VHHTQQKEESKETAYMTRKGGVVDGEDREMEAEDKREDTRAMTTTTSTHVDTRNGDVVAVLPGSRTERPVTGDGAAPPSPTSAHHMNAAVLNGVTYPSARAAAIAKEAVDAAQMYYNLFFQANEDASAALGGSAMTAVRRRRSDSRTDHHRCSGKDRMEDDPPASAAATAELQRSGRKVSQDDGSSLRASRTSSVHSNETSLLSVQTPVNVVDTAYHTFFPPVLSSTRREAIVERIVGHPPRPYHQWQWRKAEDYHALHAQNVHHNNVYHEGPANVWAGGKGLTAAATPTATPAASMETPLSTSPSYPTMSPVACVAGVNGRRTSANVADGGAARESTMSVSAGSVDEAGSSGAPHSTGDGAPTGARLPKEPSFLLNEMPFELMSQLSMYTIPASQQGPEYFKKTAEDGTKTLIIFMMGLPARGKTFLAQKICRLLGWHGSRAKVQNIQVAWRRVLLDWEATHADQLAAGHKRTDADSEASCAGITATTAPREASAPILSTTVSVPDIHHNHRRSHALTGKHPFHSSTQDEVSRVVRGLATGALASTTRWPAEMAETAVGTKVHASGVAVPRGQPSPAPTPQSASVASSVCPSMEPYTALLRAGSAVASPPSPAAAAASASPTTVLSDCASDVAVAGSPLDTALHSRPTTPTSHTSATGETAFANVAGTAALVEDKVDDATRPALPAEVLRTRHFKDLLQKPSSVARRLYRYVLQSFADDCRLFFQHGGEVVVINDDFVTEELRQEAEALFRPLAEQFFYMEVIRDAGEDPLDFVQCKIRDPMEYPRSDIDLSAAADDFHQRLQFLESVYETLEEAPRTKTEERVRAAARSQESAQWQKEAAHGGRAVGPPPLQHQLARSYVKIRNANTIETHGISGYLPSRIISYVMNLSQVKIQHPIYFVRHGESCYNLEDRIGGNPLLTEQGMRDAGALLEFLASLKHHLKHVDHMQRAQHAAPPSHHENLHVHADPAAYTSAAAAAANTANTLEMWTSQLRRAIQTAELSERLLNIRTLRWSSLNEIHAGVCEDMTYDEVTQRYPLIDYFRKRSKYTFRYPEGESYQDLVVRLEPVIMELENADKVVVVVAHQAVLRCLLAYFGSTSAESSISVEVPHRTVWRCTYDSKGIASLDELKLDNYEAGFPLRKSEQTGPAATAATTTAAATPAAVTSAAPIASRASGLGEVP